MALLARESVCLDVLRRGTRAAVLRMQLKKNARFGLFLLGGGVRCQLNAAGKTLSLLLCCARAHSGEKKKHCWR